MPGFIPNSRAEAVLKSVSGDVVGAYRSMLGKLQRILSRYHEGSPQALRLISRELDTAFALRARIITEGITRASAEQYRDTLYQARRLMIRYTGIKTKRPIDLDGLDLIMQQRIEANGVVDTALQKQKALELKRVRETLQTTWDFPSLKKEITKCLGDSTRIIYNRGRQMLNDAQAVSLESTHARDLWDFYGVGDGDIVYCWDYGNAPRNDPRDHHMILDGAAPDMGYFWSDLTGAYTERPRYWVDDSENVGCKCASALAPVWHTEVDRVSTASGVISIPRGSYLLWLKG